MITINGQKYKLGQLAFSEENVSLFESLLAMTEADAGTMPIKEFRRALYESLTDGNGVEKADEAMAGLKFDFSAGSDLQNAFMALGKSLGGGCD